MSAPSTFVARGGLLAVAAAGAAGAAALSLDHVETGVVCPALGPLPICMLILAGYLAIAAAAVVPRRLSAVFWFGWAPVAGFAALGAGMELTVGDTCPRAFGAVPQCFISLALAAAALILFLLLSRRR